MKVRHHPQIKKAIEKKHSILVLGPRGSGKTVYLTDLITKKPRHRIINLLNSAEFRKYLSNPSLLFDEVSFELKQNNKEVLYLMIDEVQLLPNLMYEVHRLIDSERKKLVFILTGSSARKLKEKDVDLLASRAISLKFYPFHSSEIDYKKELTKLLRFGSLPEIYSFDDEWLKKEKLKTYVGTYLNEEIKKESNVRNIESFSTFLEYAGVMNGQPVNFSKVAKAAGVSSPTIKGYYNILVDTLIATEIPAWSHSAKERLVKASKYYIFDNGVLNALTNEGFDEVSSGSYIFGKLFENLVINELIRQIRFKEKICRYYHYRDINGAEVDLILQKNAFSPAVAIEIKSSSQPGLSKIKGLERFRKLHPDTNCYVLARNTEGYEKNGITFLNFIDGIEEVLKDF